MSLVMLLSMACIATDIASGPTGMEITKTNRLWKTKSKGSAPAMTGLWRLKVNNFSNSEVVKECSTSYKEALYVNGNGDLSHQRFINELTFIFSNCNRILSNEGMMIFTFHHRKIGAWKAIAKAAIPIPRMRTIVHDMLI
jgi:hypothetical protein